MTRADIEDKVLATLAALLNASRAELSPQSTRESLTAWDSLKHMHLVLALEEAFGIEFDDAEIASLTSVPGLVDAVAAKVEI